MYIFGKFIFGMVIILGVLNSLILLGGVVELLQQYIGYLSYFISILVVTFFSPALIVLPWFDAWVSNSPVNDNVLFLWSAFIVCLILRVILWKWAPDKE